jgi:anti-sigma28 factor (negative regulator of flagellin synthesis)
MEREVVMVDEIKLDGFSIPVSVNKKADDSKIVAHKPAATNDDTVSVNNDLGKVIKLMVAEYNPAADAARVAATKDMIKNNQYIPDRDALAEQLTQLFSKRING